MIVNERSLVTSDRGIYESALDEGFKALLISQGHVSLPGEGYGFIGGASGVIDNERVILLGDIALHPDRENISRFVSTSGVELIILDDLPLLDAGTLIILKSNS